MKIKLIESSENSSKIRHSIKMGVYQSSEMGKFVGMQASNLEIARGHNNARKTSSDVQRSHFIQITSAGVSATRWLRTGRGSSTFKVNAIFFAK